MHPISIAIISVPGLLAIIALIRAVLAVALGNPLSAFGWLLLVGFLVVATFLVALVLAASEGDPQ